MPSKTVKITIEGLFQNALPFDGVIRFKLSRPCRADEQYILPDKWQEVGFRSNGVSVVELIPNSLLGERTFYEFEVVRKRFGVPMSEKSIRLNTIHRGAIYVPDYDCNFVDLAVLAHDIPDLFGACYALASQAKQAAAQANQKLDTLANISAEATTLEPEAEATADFDSETGVLALGIPRGKQGEKGETGDVVTAFGQFSIDDSVLVLDYVGKDDEPVFTINEAGELEVDV